MNRPALVAAVLAGAAATAIAPTAASAAAYSPCLPARPGSAFYAAGRVASTPVTVPRSNCTTIAVSDVRDAQNPSDTCQTFLLALLPAAGGDPTYTEPVAACSGGRTVLATNVPDGTKFRVLYQVDYIDPAPQVVRYTVWR